MAGTRHNLAIAAMASLVLLLFVPGLALAENYEGGQLLTTVQSGVVSGGLYVDATPPAFGYGVNLNQTKTFALPAEALSAPGRIAWARLYVSVYTGHMQNNYATQAYVSLDADGDGAFETELDPLLQSENVPFNFIVNGGNPLPSGGQPWATIDDHTTRVSSDYLMWYNVTGLLAGQHPGVHVDTRGSFDGRIKVITLVVAYNDGDADHVYYWVNQGHDVDSYYADYPVYAPLEWNDYIGTTSFSGIPDGFASATLTVNHMASSDGLYALEGSNLTRHDSSGGNTSIQGAYSGFDVWDVSGYIAGDSAKLTFDRSAVDDDSGDYGGQYYKIPLAALAVRMSAEGTDDGSLSFIPAAVNCAPGEVKAFDLVIDRLPEGISGYGLEVALNASGVAEIVGISFPAWAIVNDHSTLPADTVSLRAVDVSKLVGAGASNVTLATIYVRGVLAGAASLDIDVAEIDSDSGDPVGVAVEPGTMVVSSPVFVVSLVSGWNLVSWPVNNSTLRASDLTGNVSLGVDIVAYYNNTTGGYTMYYPGASSWKNVVLRPDAGLFLHATKASGFGVSGEAVPGHYVDLYGGWNLIGWSSFTNVSARDVMGRVSLSMVARYDAAQGMFPMYYPGASQSKNFNLTAGNGYFLQSQVANVQRLYTG